MKNPNRVEAGRTVGLRYGRENGRRNVKYALAAILKQPEKMKENGRRNVHFAHEFLSEHKEILRDVGRRTGPINVIRAREAVMKTPEKLIANLEKARKVLDEHPEIRRETGRKSGLRNIVKMREHLGLHPEVLVRGGRTQGRIMVESGLIKKVQRAAVYARTNVPNDHHHPNHGSKAESRLCRERYLPLYGRRLHANVWFEGRELDWIVGKSGIHFNRRDSATWERVIEFHPYGRELTFSQYSRRRKYLLRSLGIACPIEVICF
jgi:hypothetical protein